MYAILTGLTRVDAYIDDIIVKGTTQEDLLQRLICVLDLIQQYGFRLKADKFPFFQLSIEYFELILEKMVGDQTENIQCYNAYDSTNGC